MSGFEKRQIDTFDKIVDLLVEDGYIDTHSLRNFRIQKRYNELRKDNSCKKAREVVAEEFALTEKAIQVIVYSQKVDYENGNK